MRSSPTLPQNGPAGYKGAVYFVDAGPAHIVSAFSEDRGEPHRINDTQLAWLEDDLGKHENSLFKFVMTHDPLVRAGDNSLKFPEQAAQGATAPGLDVFSDQREKLVQLLGRYKAVFLSGHQLWGGRTSAVVCRSS